MYLKDNPDLVLESSVKTNYPSTKFSFFNNQTNVVNFQKKLPVICIDTDNSESDLIISKNKLSFFYHVMVKTIESCLSATYTDFDAHTTSTCCHGIALLVQDLIFSIKHLDLRSLQVEGLNRIEALSKNN